MSIMAPRFFIAPLYLPGDGLQTVVGLPHRHRQFSLNPQSKANRILGDPPLWIAKRPEENVRGPLLALPRCRSSIPWDPVIAITERP